MNLKLYKLVEGDREEHLVGTATNLEEVRELLCKVEPEGAYQLLGSVTRVVDFTIHYRNREEAYRHIEDDWSAAKEETTVSEKKLPLIPYLLWGFALLVFTGMAYLLWQVASSETLQTMLRSGN